MIRKCDKGDVDWLVELATRFNNKHFGIPINPDKSRHYLDQMVEYGICFRGNNGAIVGVIAPDPFRDWTVLVEIGWFTDKPGEGLALLDEFIDAGREWGVDEVRMTTLEVNKSVATVLERKGFKPVETSHRLLL